MEITLSTVAQAVTIDQKLEPILKSKRVRPEGLVNSNYKAIAKHNLRNRSSKSIFGVRQALKSRQYQFTSSIDTILKLSVFAIVLSVIL